uniref:Uncharacterized protein n=1 Tax=Oryza sativa subsp. japonica TaxID=39947 RepID=Q6K432_ORYSJ|nr:hypothetical protein [Oryza sativa Japonica Group]
MDEGRPGYTFIGPGGGDRGRVGRQRPAKWRGIVGSWGAKLAPVFGEKRGRWRRGVASGPTRERARGGREWRRRGRFSAAMAATAAAGLRLGMTGGVHGSHLSEREGGRGRLGRQNRLEGEREPSGPREEAGPRGRERRGWAERGPKRGKRILIVFFLF